MTPPIESEEVTTPDVLSSSPGGNAMDLSPLPHKAPYFVSQVTLPSPSPEITPDIEDEFSSELLCDQQQSIAQASTSQPPTFLQLPEYVFCHSLVLHNANRPRQAPTTAHASFALTQ